MTAQRAIHLLLSTGYLSALISSKVFNAIHRSKNPKLTFMCRLILKHNLLSLLWLSAGLGDASSLHATYIGMSGWNHTRLASLAPQADLGLTQTDRRQSAKPSDTLEPCKTSKPLLRDVGQDTILCYVMLYYIILYYIIL